MKTRIRGDKTLQKSPALLRGMGLPFFSSIHRSSPYLRRYIIGYDSKVSSISRTSSKCFSRPDLNAPKYISASVISEILQSNETNNGNKETVCTAADARRGVETACRILAVSGEGLGKSASMSVTYDEEEI